MNVEIAIIGGHLVALGLGGLIAYGGGHIVKQGFQTANYVPGFLTLACLMGSLIIAIGSGVILTSIGLPWTAGGTN